VLVVSHLCRCIIETESTARATPVGLPFVGTPDPSISLSHSLSIYIYFIVVAVELAKTNKVGRNEIIIVNNNKKATTIHPETRTRVSPTRVSPDNDTRPVSYRNKSGPRQGLPRRQKQNARAVVPAIMILLLLLIYDDEVGGKQKP
jgi:hypothetical protein